MPASKSTKIVKQQSTLICFGCSIWEWMNSQRRGWWFKRRRQHRQWWWPNGGATKEVWDDWGKGLDDACQRWHCSIEPICILVTLNCFRKRWQMAIWIKCTMIMEPSASTRCSSGSSQRLASRDSTSSLPWGCGITLFSSSLMVRSNHAKPLWSVRWNYNFSASRCTLLWVSAVRAIKGLPSVNYCRSIRKALDAVGTVKESMLCGAFSDMQWCMHFAEDWEENEGDVWNNYYTDEKVDSPTEVAHHHLWSLKMYSTSNGRRPWSLGGSWRWTKPNTRLVSWPHHTRARAKASPHRCNDAHHLQRQDWWGSSILSQDLQVTFSRGIGRSPIGFTAIAWWQHLTTRPSRPSSFCSVMDGFLPIQVIHPGTVPICRLEERKTMHASGVPAMGMFLTQK